VHRTEIAVRRCREAFLSRSAPDLGDLASKFSSDRDGELVRLIERLNCVREND